MERERKGRQRSGHRWRPFLASLGVLTVSKTGEVRPAWREMSITVLLVAALTVLLLPWLQMPMRTLAVGDIAPADIKAPTDLLIEDEVSTHKKRQEAEERVLPVYDFDRQAVQSIDRRLTLALRSIQSVYENRPAALMGALSTSDPTPMTPEETARVRGLHGAQAQVFQENLVTSPLFQEREAEFQHLLEIELSEATLDALRQIPDVAGMREGIIQAVSQVMQHGIVGQADLLADPREKGIILRDQQGARERTVTDPAALLELREASEAVAKVAAAASLSYPRPVQQSVLELARKLLQANVTFNKQETEERTRKAAEEVKPVFFQIKRGEMIVREGERVREEHMSKLRALTAAKRRGDPVAAVAGTAIFVALVIGFGLLYLRQFQPKLLAEHQGILLLAVLLVGSLLCLRISMVLVHALAESLLLVEASMLLYALPLAAGGMLVTIFFGFDIGVLFSVMTSLLVGVLLRDNLEMPILALLGNLVAAFRVNQYTQRSSILLTGLLIGLANILTLMALALMSSNLFFAWQRVSEALCGLLGGLIAAVVVSAVLPLFESLFKLTTDIKLLELANLNHPLMRQMIVHAPGTYHHSMLVGTLAEAGAEAIGASALLARVGSYYHDIGKMLTPEYFVENQANHENKHDRLSPSMSALIIIAHVKDGIKLAKEYKLPQRIIDIIPQHHGTNRK
jgi:putative nucleotidyltransferase with HDIG domain